MRRRKRFTRFERNPSARIRASTRWTQVETLHKVYGDVLGITEGKDPQATAANLLERLRFAQRSMANYPLQVAAVAANDEAFDVLGHQS